MDIDRVKEWISEFNEEALLADGFEEAIIGVCERAGSPPVVAYNRDLCIDILLSDGIEEALNEYEDVEAIPEERYQELCEDAIEYFEYNVLGSYVGEHTPVFLTVLPEELVGE